MPELGYGTVNRYLPPRAWAAGGPSPAEDTDAAASPAEPAPDLDAHPFLRWVDRLLSA